MLKDEKPWHEPSTHPDEKIRSHLMYVRPLWDYVFDRLGSPEVARVYYTQHLARVEVAQTLGEEYRDAWLRWWELRLRIPRQVPDGFQKQWKKWGAPNNITATVHAATLDAEANLRFALEAFDHFDIKLSLAEMVAVGRNSTVIDWTRRWREGESFRKPKVGVPPSPWAGSEEDRRRWTTDPRPLLSRVGYRGPLGKRKAKQAATPTAPVLLTSADADTASWPEEKSYREHCVTLVGGGDPAWQDGHVLAALDAAVVAEEQKGYWETELRRREGVFRDAVAAARELALTGKFDAE